MIRKTPILAGWRITLQQSSTVQRGAGSRVQTAEESCTLKNILYEKIHTKMMRKFDFSRKIMELTIVDSSKSEQSKGMMV